MDDGTYVDLPISLTVQTGGATPTPEPSTQPTTQPTDSPAATEKPETIPDTSDTSDDQQFTASVDGVEMGSSIEMEVPRDGKVVLITIELPETHMIYQLRLSPKATFRIMLGT